MQPHHALTLLAGLMVACATTTDKNPYDTDTDTDTVDTDTVDTDTDTVVDTDDTDTVDTDDTDTDVVDTDDTDLPTDELIVVTDECALSGYFSEQFGADSYVVTENTNCTSRGGSARGDCLQIVYNRDPDNNGLGPSYSGWFFLDALNDPNDGWANGPLVDLGGTGSTVTFWAWGAVGGEMVNFKAGIADDINGGEINTDVTLTTTPTEYTIDVSARAWTAVLGPFGFGITTAPLNNQTFTFYIDDIVWN